MKKFILFLTVFSIFFVFVGCSQKTEKPSPSQSVVTKDEIVPDKDMIFSASTYIAEVKILEKTNEFFSNPDGTRKTEEGTVALNSWITEYKVEIITMYKGVYPEKTFTIRTYNGEGLEDGTFDKNSDRNFYLTEGQECILSLYDYVETGGYGTGRNIVPLFGVYSYFQPTETEGQYKNISNLILDVSTLKAELKKY